MSLFAAQVGAQPLIETVDSIQAGLFGMVLEKIFIAELQKVTGKFILLYLPESELSDW